MMTQRNESESGEVEKKQFCMHETNQWRRTKGNDARIGRYFLLLLLPLLLHKTWDVFKLFQVTHNRSYIFLYPVSSIHVLLSSLSSFQKLIVCHINLMPFKQDIWRSGRRGRKSSYVPLFLFPLFMKREKRKRWCLLWWSTHVRRKRWEGYSSHFCLNSILVCLWMHFVSQDHLLFWRNETWGWESRNFHAFLAMVFILILIWNPS